MGGSLKYAPQNIQLRPILVAKMQHALVGAESDSRHNCQLRPQTTDSDMFYIFLEPFLHNSQRPTATPASQKTYH
jgi:hypothetical protein